MNMRGALILGAMAILVTAGTAHADKFQTFSGNNAGAPTFNRPVGDGSGGLSGVNARFRTQRFRLAGPTNCVINGTQDYDGYLHLYQTSFNSALPLNNLVDGDDDAELGIGTSRIPHDLNTPSIALAAGNYILVTSGFSNSSVGPFENFVSCNGDVQPTHGTCGISFTGIPAEQQVCLQDRFLVAIDQVTNHPTNGIATPVRFGSTDSAFFWFYNDRNFEVLLKVLNGCPVNGNWWVFFAGTTNQGYRVRVADNTTLQIETYNRSQGPPSLTETVVVNPFPCP
jgi:hypothetical protein